MVAALSASWMVIDCFLCCFVSQLLQQFTFAQDPGQYTEQRTHGPFIELLQFSASLFENAAKPVHAASASAKHLQLLFVIGDGRIDRGEGSAACQALSNAHTQPFNWLTVRRDCDLRT